MKKVLVSVGALLVLSLIFLNSCNNPSSTKESTKEANSPVPSKADTTKKDSTHAAQAYVCPMGPQCGQGDKAGKCPSCGMDMKENPDFKKK
jgi:hypothetical protein